MPKIRDLAISIIPSERPANGRPGGGYWMCQKTPTIPPCPPQSTAKPNPKPKNAGGLPNHAVTQLREQLRQQIGR
jgi:hypothetical protein